MGSSMAQSWCWSTAQLVTLTLEHGWRCTKEADDPSRNTQPPLTPWWRRRRHKAQTPRHNPPGASVGPGSWQGVNVEGHCVRVRVIITHQHCNCLFPVGETDSGTLKNKYCMHHKVSQFPTFTQLSFSSRRNWFGNSEKQTLHASKSVPILNFYTPVFFQ